MVVSTKMLVLSPLASLEGRAHLLAVTQCQHMLYGEGFYDLVADTIALHPQTLPSAVASLSTWLTPTPAVQYSYTRPWSTAWSDPVVIFHTSGTTGLPKPITWNNAMMSYNDASARLPRGDDNITARIGRTRYYTTTGNGPGVSSSLQHSIWRGAIVVFGPTHRWPSSTLATEIISRANVGSMMTTPHIIEAMASTPDGDAALRQLELLLWTGAPLNETVGAELAAKGTLRLAPIYGTTECAGLQMHVCAERGDWNVYEFQVGQGIEFDAQSTSDLFELVIRRGKTNKLGQPQMTEGYVQPVFCALPELDEWRSRDLFAPAEGTEGLWRYRGRKDDFILLSNGVGLLPQLYEPLILAHRAVDGVLIGGQGRAAPFLLVQLAEQDGMQADSRELDDVWATIERDVNKPFLGDWVRLRRDKILVTSLDRPFVWTEKGTPSRKAMLNVYQDEIEALYT